MAIDKSALNAYVEEKKSGLIRNAVIGAKSASEFNLMTGVKGATTLNLLNTTVVFGDGSTCGWNEAGTSALSQRVLTPGQIKINMSFCDKALLSTWMNYDVKVAAGQKTLPFEEDFINGVIEGVKAKLEKTIWQGDTTGTYSGFNGIAKVLNGTSYVEVTYTAADSVNTAVNKTYAAIPSECFEKGDVVMFMGSDMYRTYIQELIANGNLVITNTVNDVPMPDSILIPGTNVRVIGVSGLDGTGSIYASYRDNFFYGTDMQGDEEKFEFWYSQDNREFRLAIEFNAGVQVAYPDMVVVASVTEGQQEGGSAQGAGGAGTGTGTGAGQ